MRRADRYPVYGCCTGKHGQHRSFRAAAHCYSVMLAKQPDSYVPRVLGQTSAVSEATRPEPIARVGGSGT